MFLIIVFQNLDQDRLPKTVLLRLFDTCSLQCTYIHTCICLQKPSPTFSWFLSLILALQIPLHLYFGSDNGLMLYPDFLSTKSVIFPYSVSPSYLYFNFVIETLEVKFDHCSVLFNYIILYYSSFVEKKTN